VRMQNDQGYTTGGRRRAAGESDIRPRFCRSAESAASAP
jgi:hypothetical protein